MDAIKLTKLLRIYGNKKAVDSVSLTVAEGEVFGLLGPNGAGKSTLLSMMTTLLRPTEGEIKVCGYNVIKHGKEVRKVIGIVFQDFLLDKDLTAFDNLDIHARLYKLDKRERPQAIENVLKVVGLETERKSKVSTFSGGMKRRLEIARAFLARPRVLFLDEPTLGLDPVAKRDVWKYIKSLNKNQKVTIVIATNSMEEAEHLCQRAAIINKGKIIKLGKISQIKKILGKRKSLEEAFIHLTTE